jgi:anti-sigma factor RsiW
MTIDTMGTEDSFTDRLSEYLDDEMSAAERAELEAHLAGCAACRTTLIELRAVVARASSLTDAPPSTDLWSGVETRIASSRSALPFVSTRRRFSFTLPQLVAAGLALMVSRLARANFADTHYDQAISDLEKTLDEGRSRLDPETVRVLEANLMAIDQAIDQCRKALRNDPSNVYLNNHFVESRNRKLALLRRATALTMETGS